MNIERREEPGHFGLVCNLTDESIALLEEEVKFLRGKLEILNNKHVHSDQWK